MPDRPSDVPSLEKTALSAPSPSAPLQASVPRQLLHYEVLGLLGQGGMGAVYKARDQRLGRLVAIKRVVGEGDAALSERLVLEARAASALAHPHIVTIHAIEESPEGAFMVMELLDGEPLDAAIARGPLPSGRVATLGAEIAEGLACAHAAGLIHRDIKPANVFLTPHGAKLLDFGIAKQGSLGASPLTGAGAIVGTWPYMSPEQLRGEPLDGRSDLFALGAVLYEACTGRRAFPAEAVAQLVQQITAQDVVRPSAVAPAVPEWLEAIVLRALRRDRAERFASAAELAAALRGIAEVRPSRPVSQPAAPKATSVGVLAFRDLSPAGDQAYLCLGIAEEILTALVGVPGLRVAARAASLKLSAASVDPREAGQRLGVDAVLDGAVRRAGDKLRVNVQLVDVSSGDERWAKRFDGSADEVFAIQDEIAAAVASTLRGAITGEVRPFVRRPETTPEVYDCVLRARQQLQVRTKVSLEDAVNLLKRAIELDPHYAPAYALLAMVYGEFLDWYVVTPETRLAADQASARAVELAPDLGESRTARGRVLSAMRRYPEAEAELEAALRTNPQLFEAHYYLGRLCFQTGRPEEALQAFRRAAEVQPDDFQCLILGAPAAEKLKRYDEAAAMAAEGLRRAQKLLAIDPYNPRALALCAPNLAHLGRREEALEMARRAVKHWPDDLMVTANAACAFSVLGEKEAALEQLERTFANGHGNRDWIAHDPDYDSLRDEPRFLALLQRMT